MNKQLSKMVFFRAQGAVEYVLLISMFVVGAVLVLNLFGISVSDVYCDITKALGSEKACASNEAYCNDSFDGALSDWKSFYGKPSTTDGKMCFSTDMLSTNKCSMDKKQSDYAVKMDDVVLTTGNGYGVFFRATDDGKGLNGYAFQYDPGLRSGKNPNGALIIRKWVNGREISEPIAVAPMGPDVYNTPHDIEVSGKGDEITVFMDGKQVLAAKDGTYTSGGSAIRSWDSTSACIGNFSLLELPK